MLSPTKPIDMHGAGPTSREEVLEVEVQRLKRKDANTANAHSAFADYLRREVMRDRSATAILDRFTSMFPEAR